MNIEVIKFKAEWCNPCKTYTPFFNSAKQARPDVSFKEVDVDVERNLVERFNIRSVPTTLILQNGAVVHQLTGILTKEQLLSLIPKN